jgi:hypothetical protein
VDQELTRYLALEKALLQAMTSNRTEPKTVLTGANRQVQVEVPRDQDGPFKL